MNHKNVNKFNSLTERQHENSEMKETIPAKTMTVTDERMRSMKCGASTSRQEYKVRPHGNNRALAFAAGRHVTECDHIQRKMVNAISRPLHHCAGNHATIELQS